MDNNTFKGTNYSHFSYLCPSIFVTKILYNEKINLATFSNNCCYRQFLHFFLFFQPKGFAKADKPTTAGGGHPAKDEWIDSIV